jgi:hypothetical protein
LEICGNDIRVEGKLIRIARLELDKYEFLDNPQPVVEGLRKAKGRVDLFTFLQRPPDAAPKFDYPMMMDNLAVVPVSTFDHWWNKQLRSQPRNRARQAEKKGVVVREVPFDDVLVRGISEVYNESPIRQGVPFKHYGKDIETIRKISATFLERSIFIGAFLNDQLIGFIKLVTDQANTQANTMHIVSMMKHRDKAPTNAMVAEAVRACAKRGIRYLVYQNFAYGNKQGDSLSQFKENNGFERMDVPRYYVPLTLTGSIALRLGLYRKFTDILPEPVAEKLRSLRKAWYDRKFVAAPEAS